jgi:hypothetical protein
MIMLRRITQVVVLAGCLAIAGQASAHSRGPGPAFLGAVVGAVVGGAIVSHSYAREPVYVEGPPPPPPPRVVYYEPAPVYEYRVVEPRPVYYGPPPGAYYYGPPPRW